MNAAHVLVPRKLRVLTVFRSPEHRSTVRSCLLAEHPDNLCTDAATATDAVLVLLAHRVDLVLADVDWAGDLLPALVRHMHRSAPQATMLAFADAARPAPGGATGYALRGIHAWAELPVALATWLAGWRTGAGAPVPGPEGQG